MVREIVTGGGRAMLARADVTVRSEVEALAWRVPAGARGSIGFIAC